MAPAAPAKAPRHPRGHPVSERRNPNCSIRQSGRGLFVALHYGHGASGRGLARVSYVDWAPDESPLVPRFQTFRAGVTFAAMCQQRSLSLSAPFREVTFCASYKCHCFGVKGSRLSWFRPCSALSDLEHVIALATSPRCLGRPRHVQLLLLLDDVGKHRTKALVLDDGSLIDLRPLVEGPIREV